MRNGPAWFSPPRITGSEQPRHRIGMVSTYPPKICGLATFASALERELRLLGNEVDIVRIDDGRDMSPKQWPVVADLSNGIPRSIVNVASLLSKYDVAIIQHEYGIFGGVDGDEVLQLIDGITAPTIVVLHTVALTPTTHQRFVLIELVERADKVVVMSDVARQRLATYGVDLRKVAMVPHGATPQPIESSVDSARRSARVNSGRIQMLTWGLLGPGKGIEHVINAMARFDDATTRPHYTIAGVTHPNVLAHSGDVYRNGLIERTFASRVAPWVTFDAKYRSVDELTRFVLSKALVVLPYDSPDQVTSGVLVDAIALGRPVIATAFPHAVELLSSGAGILVPHQDPVSLAEAIRSVTANPDHLAAMTAEATRIAPSLRWSTVAEQYVHLADDLVRVVERVAV